jgi:hypothetical protein
MATNGHRKVARVLIAEEEEFMEIDTPQGSALKKNIGKIVDSTETSNKKKNKSGELLFTSALEKQDRRYWLSFNYMEQLAIEVGTSECHSDGPVEDLVTQGYLQNEAEELEQAIVSYPRIPQKLYSSRRSDKVLGQHFNLI